MIISTFLRAIFEILSMILNAYIWVIIIQSLIQIFQPTLRHPAIDLLNRLTQPLYQKIKRSIRVVYNHIDFSPLIAVIGLEFIDLFLIRLILKNL